MPRFLMWNGCRARQFSVIFSVLLFSACATTQERPLASDQMEGIEPTVVSYSEYRDPLIRMNRAIFAFNDVSYRYVMIPMSRAYSWLLPDPVEKSVSNFFYNIKTPIYAVNHLLQFKPKPFGTNLLRFTINSTLGLLGLFDPAEAWFGLQRAPTSFDESLSTYGAGYGIYLVLPLLGSSNARGAPGLLVDHFLNPIPYLVDNPESTAILALDGFQQFDSQAERYMALRNKTDDPYLFFRNLSLQGVQRDADYRFVPK